MLCTQERLSVMPRPSLVSLCIASVAFACALPVVAHADDTFSVTPSQVVTLGNGEGDAFAVEQISRNDNMVTVLLRPKGESCTFRFARRRRPQRATALQFRLGPVHAVQGDAAAADAR